MTAKIVFAILVVMIFVLARDKRNLEYCLGLYMDGSPLAELRCPSDHDRPEEEYCAIPLYC